MKLIKLFALLLLIYKALRYMMTDISVFGYEMGKVK